MGVRCFRIQPLTHRSIVFRFDFRILLHNRRIKGLWARLFADCRSNIFSSLVLVTWKTQHSTMVIVPQRTTFSAAATGPLGCVWAIYPSMMLEKLKEQFNDIKSIPASLPDLVPYSPTAAYISHETSEALTARGILAVREGWIHVPLGEWAC